MRCKSCNKPFTPTLSKRYSKLSFSTMCSNCSSKSFMGYTSSHEHIHGIDEEPTAIVAQKGSIRVEEY